MNEAPVPFVTSQSAHVQHIHFLKSAEASKRYNFPSSLGSSLTEHAAEWNVFHNMGPFYFFLKESGLQLSNERELWVCFT